MKNKLFYGLFLVYAVMVAFILYINGVFTGEVESVSNLVINVVFLAIIGVMFVISAVSFMRLNRLTDELEAVALEMQAEYKKAGNKNLWNVLQESKGLFQEENLQVAFGKYRMRVKSSRTGKYFAANCDIEEYINEELLEKVGMNFYNSGISGTMTGLGILGTFIGLSLGLGSFNGDDIYTISDNVGPLLSGMKVAFHTSVYGIIFSLVFNYVYRSIMADAYAKLDLFLSTFKQCAMPPTAGNGDDNTAAMLVYLANQANYMKQLLELAKGESADQTASMEHMVRMFIAQLQNTMGTEIKELGTVLNSTAKMHAMEMESSEKIVIAARELVEASRSMQETMQRMQKQQEQFARELAEQKQTLEKACEEISSDVSNQLYTFGQMRAMYEKE